MAPTPCFRWIANSLAIGALLCGAPAHAASLLWEASHDIAFTGSISVKAAAADGAGNLVVTGTYLSGATTACKTVKFAAATGAVVWEKTCPSTGILLNQPVGLVLDAAGHAFVAIRSGFDSTNSANRIVKYAAADGATIWDKPWGNPADGGDSLNAIAIDASGNVFATGSYGSTDAYWMTAKYSGFNGYVLWQQSFNPSVGRFDGAHALAVDAAGNVIVAGRTVVGNTAVDMVTIKYNGANGVPMWSSTMPAATSGHGNTPVAVGVDAAGNAIVAWTSINVYGGKITTIPLYTVGHLVKYAAGNGAQQWATTLDVPLGFTRGPLALAVDPGGDAFVATTVFGSPLPSVGTDTDMWTARFAGSTGEMRWSRKFHGNGISPDVAQGIALDAGGNPVVTGQGINEVDADIRTIKYSATDGSILWEHGYNGPGAGFGWGIVPVAVPGAVLVAGEFQDTTGANFGWRVLKLSDTPGPVPRVSFDFNADGRADLLFRYADGTIAMWLMDGMATTSIAGLFAPGSGVSIHGIADFDGNGSADLLWELPDVLAVSLMDGATFASTAGILGAGSGWTPAFTADFDGDGKADIVLRHADGSHAVLIMQGTTVARSFGILGPGTGWSVVRVGDFDGGGKADVVIRHEDGSHAIAFLDGFGATDFGGLVGPGTGDEISTVADFSGDAISDLLWKRADGSYAMQVLRGLPVSLQTAFLPAGTGLDMTLAADFDGDRRADLLAADAAGTHVILIVRGNGIDSVGAILGPGSGWTAVAARDFDGDGRADLLLRRSDGVYAAGRVIGTTMPTAAGVVGPPWALTP